VFPSFRSRLEEARRTGDLYFASLLSKETIQAAFGDAGKILDSARIDTTSVTLWTFLTQVLSSHHGCVVAVAKLIACRLASGLSACSAETGAYCIARDKLDEPSMQRLVQNTGRAIENTAPNNWLWLGHRVVVADGCTVTMPDTAKNQAEYPQTRSQRPGCGFPIMRCVVLFALATGVVLEAAMGKYRGKLTAEVSLFREIDEVLEKDDVFLADRAYSGWFEMARLIARGVHVVVRKHQARKTDFRTGVRLGKDDHLVTLAKPSKPEWMSQVEYEGYHKCLLLREIRIRVQTPGFRPREIVVMTSLLDAADYTHENLAVLFRRRWQAELNLRSLKSVMQMDHLRCLEPHRVRTELRTHLIAYNLIRQVMSEAAVEGGVEPWQISFKGALTTMVELLPVLSAIRDPDDLCKALLACCLQHKVGNRPDRYEPRVVKRRAKPYKLMSKPRSEYKPGNE
jgi:hypothetical protein